MPKPCTFQPFFICNCDITRPPARHEPSIAGLLGSAVQARHQPAEPLVHQVHTAVDRPFLGQVDVAKEVEAKGALVPDVLESGHHRPGERVHALAHLRDGVVGAAPKERKVEEGGLDAGAEAQFDIVGQFRAEAGVADGDVLWVGGVEVGVELLEARALDAAVVAEFERRAFLEGLGEVDARHPVVVAWDVDAAVLAGFRLDGSAFVADARFEGELVLGGQGVGGIACGHVLAVVEVAGRAAVVESVGRCWAVGHLVLVVAVHPAEDALAAKLEQLVLLDGRDEVALQRDLLVEVAVEVLLPTDDLVGGVEQVGLEVVGEVVAAILGGDAPLLLGL